MYKTLIAPFAPWEYRWRFAPLSLSELNNFARTSARSRGESIYPDENQLISTRGKINHDLLSFLLLLSFVNFGIRSRTARPVYFARGKKKTLRRNCDTVYENNTRRRTKLGSEFIFLFSARLSGLYISVNEPSAFTPRTDVIRPAVDRDKRVLARKAHRVNDFC